MGKQSVLTKVVVNARWSSMAGFTQNRFYYVTYIIEFLFSANFASYPIAVIKFKTSVISLSPACKLSQVVDIYGALWTAFNALSVLVL